MENTLQMQPPSGGQDLARWLGRREAFGMIAGRCSAADVECLRQIRERKLYLDTSPNWDEFCKLQLKASRRKIDTSIRHLEEFGPAFFHLAQLTRITADDYRAIAGHVSEAGVTLNGEVIALLPENCERVADAVGQLRAAAEAPPEQTAGGIHGILKRCDALVRLLEETPPLEAAERIELTAAIARVNNAAARLGVILFVL